MFATTLFFLSAALGAAGLVLGRAADKKRESRWILGLSGISLIAAILLT